MLKVGQKVRLKDSLFLRRNVGELEWVSDALAEGTVLTVAHTHPIYGEQFVSVRGSGVPSHMPLSARLFEPVAQGE